METTAPAVPPRHPKFVRWALLLGIVVILNIFFWRLTDLIIPSPDYNNYCAAALNNAPAQNEAASCQTAGGIWTEYDNGTSAGLTSPKMPGYCSCTQANQDAFSAALNQHDLYAFIAMVVLGIVALVLGLFPTGSSIVSSGLSYGGVVALIFGAGRYWSSANQWIQLLIAAVGLGLLLYIGWRKFRD